MAKIYSNINRIKFTDISERYELPRRYKGKLTEVHSSLIDYVVKNYKNTNRFRKLVVDALNILTYCILENEIPPFDWRMTNPLENVPSMDMDLVEQILGDYYLDADAIEWDVAEVDTPPETPLIKPEPIPVTAAKEPSSQPDSKYEPPKIKDIVKAADRAGFRNPTSKEDLYIQPPKCPRFDYSKKWFTAKDGMNVYTIYATLPEIPTKQNEISCTTDSSKMTNADLLRLYPTEVVRTRPPAMYEQIDGLENHPILGNILPVEGYSKSELADNLIKYPHLYKVKRLIDGELVNFFEHIEIDGKLIPISEAWDTLPESSVIPKQSDFIKEYVIRRYLLERDNGVNHSYPIYGTLNPYLTLFMPADDYIRIGHSNVIEIARSCVDSRVSFKRSRNPILRRFDNA